MTCSQSMMRLDSASGLTPRGFAHREEDLLCAREECVGWVVVDGGLPARLDVRWLREQHMPHLPPQHRLRLGLLTVKPGCCQQSTYCNHIC